MHITVWRRYIFLVILLCIAAGKGFATHVVGGEVTYQYKGSDKYSVRLDLFIDCLNGSPGAIAQDATAFFYVFYKNTNALVTGFPLEIGRSGPERLVKLNYNCLGNTPNACVDHYWYTTEMTLPAGKGDYIISFQRCCRNGSITNLSNPLNQGANYWTTVPDPGSLPDKTNNSSAVFRELPPNFLCINAPLKFDHSATDADGDSLVYDLFYPYLGATPSQPRPDNGGNGAPDVPPFANILYSGSYNYTVPMDGNPQLSINSKTGLLYVIPTKLGQFVVGIRVKEYRNGVLISETKRDYQFNVLDCQLNVFAAFTSPSKTCDTTVQFKNTSISASTYHWDFGVPGIADDTSNDVTPVFHYPKPGIYPVSLSVRGNNCNDTAVDTVRIGRKFKATLSAMPGTCGGKTEFLANSSAPYVKLLVDGKLYGSKKTAVSLTPGTYIAVLQVVDTIADCNDTINTSVKVEDMAADLRLANVFTPNGDGFNDCYRLAGDYQTCLKGHIVIYNRWGELVFASEGLDFCWNGKVNNTGVLLPEGVYFYQLTTETIDTKSVKKLLSGSINLMR